MATSDTAFYQRAWRWHFLAGLFLAPLLILLSVTGIIYLFKPQLDELMYPHLLQVTPITHPLSADRLAAVVQAAYPDAVLTQYLPPSAADRSAQFVLRSGERELNLFINPADGALLGALDAHDNLQAIARALHAELMLGKTGDAVIELAAGWTLLLLCSGLYLWWPRQKGGMQGILLPRPDRRGRLWWRDLHAVLGLWGAAGLLFFALSGMTWTGIWGQRFADLWNRFPAAMWNEVPSSTLSRSLNQPHQQTVAWGAETLPLPRSHAAHHGDAMAEHGTVAGRIPLQKVVDIARDRGVAPGYSISLPKGESGVFTIALFADDPRNDATLHLDQYSGQVLTDVRWQDYGAVAKTVETSVMLHMGRMYGLPHQLLMLALCLMVIGSCLSGLWIWWRRRPAGRLGLPSLPAVLPSWRGAALLLIGLGLAFPLLGASLLLVWGLDALWLAGRRLRPARA
ncbi:PepSY-associated TM helix domain-containing protein [Aeromonas simiae]|uniref:PepSY-associated TM helix domain-containing protein n=1 Tax=Aeromonas simiae TaxID=218936 RepID=UPI0005AA6BF2|nr:PepSY domain-containing protein [Aeromonas simiae]